MKDKINIRLYADSLGLPRNEIISNDERYITLLSNWILQNNKAKTIHLIDRARPNNLISDLYSQFLEDNSYFEIADIIIIHEGVCDCAPRPVPKLVRKLISRLPSFLKRKLIDFIHNNRSKMQKMGLKFYLTRGTDFELFYNLWLGKIDCSKTQVIVFNIAPTNIKTEQHSPGFTKSIIKYNKLLKRVFENSKNKNINLIDINRIISDNNNINRYIIEEDGHHLTKESHKLYFDLLISNLKFE